MNSKNINIDGIGPVLLEKSNRARRLIIYVRASEGTRVAIPTRISFEKALEFVNLKKERIQKQLVKIEQRQKQQKVLINRFQAIDKEEARQKLTYRLYQLAEDHGFRFNKVSLREQKTRWGSCSIRNNISLNIKLVLLPDELIDYVVLHELVHTRVHNHSNKFWSELDRYMANASLMSKRLKSSGLELV